MARPKVLFPSTGDSCRSRMAEAGVHIADHHSKHVDELADVTFDQVITVCDRANESCPLFIGKSTVIHVGFDDPPAFARDAVSEEETLSHYRRAN